MTSLAVVRRQLGRCCTPRFVSISFLPVPNLLPLLSITSSSCKYLSIAHIHCPLRRQWPSITVAICCRRRRRCRRLSGIVAATGPRRQAPSSGFISRLQHQASSSGVSIRPHRQASPLGSIISQQDGSWPLRRPQSAPIHAESQISRTFANTFAVQIPIDHQLQCIFH